MAQSLRKVPSWQYLLRDDPHKPQDRLTWACRTDEIGSDTYYGTKNKLREEGIPFEPRRATQITYADYDTYDYIIGMDGENMRDLQRLTKGDPQRKTYRLLEFAGISRDVADPWYTNDFDATDRDVTKGCAALLEKLRS